MDNSLEKIDQWVKQAGFETWAVSPAVTSEKAKTDLKAFNAGGYFGTMDWMVLHEDRRSDPKVLWSDVKTVLVLGMNYTPDQNPMMGLDYPDHALISCYARNKDYHDVVKKKLKQVAREMVKEWPDEEVKVFVDTAPVMEVPIASQTSVGWQGKHTCLVSPEYGSWLFLGEIFTTLDLPISEPHPHQCGTCSKCLDVCPTNAFIGPNKLDARKCISYLTIEYDGFIDPDLALKMGNRVYGCDDCLAVCPWNKFTTPTDHAAFIERDNLKGLKLDDLLMLDDEGFRKLFSGSPIKRIKWHRFIRNILIAIVNAGQTSQKDRIAALCQCDHEVVQKTARWAHGQLWPS